MSEHTRTPSVSSIVEGSHQQEFAHRGMMGAMGIGSQAFMQRVVVEEVIFDPTVIDSVREDYLRTQFGLRDISFIRNLPPNSVIGRRVLDGTESGDNAPQYFFPFFPPHMMLPIKAGEHVWVFYENNKTNAYGFWVCRITEPRDVEDLNHTHPDRKFHLDQKKGTIDKAEGNSGEDVPTFDNGGTLKSKGEKVYDAQSISISGNEKAYEKIIKESDSGKVSDYEDVPRYKKRPGDTAFQGSNNTLIVLGTDRSGEVATDTSDPKKGRSFKGKPDKDQRGKAGAIDFVAGRGQGTKTKPKKIVTNTLGKQEVSKKLDQENRNEGDPDFDKDLSRILISMKTDVDNVFNIQLSTIDKTSDPGPCDVIKSDHVRIIARKTIKFLVQPTFDSPAEDCGGFVIKENGDIVFVPSKQGVIKMGGDDANMAVMCQPTAATNAGGTVTASPIVDTLGGQIGGGGPNGQFSKKVLIK